MDQIDLPGVEQEHKRGRGRPRRWASEADRRAAEKAKRREREAARREKAQAAPHDERQRAAVALRAERLAPPAPVLAVTDEDLLELAARCPNVAEGFQYSRDVLAGTIPACKWVRLACERHERNLTQIAEAAFPFTFDALAAERALRAMQMFREVKGPNAGKRFRFSPWQRFILGSLFGWVHKASGKRRFTTAFIAVPRGNGKSSMAAPLCLYMLCLDGEGGAEVYAAAVTRDQARIVFSAAQHMARKDAEFRRRYGVEVAAHAIAQPSSASLFVPLSRDARTLDGLNVHAAVLDELAAHKTREVFDVLMTATGKREQPLLLSITTAGANQSGIGFEQWKYAQRVLDGGAEDEAFFGIIYTIDEEDDWQDEAAHMKANPNWGASVNPRAIASAARRAARIASQQSAFKQKHLNVWTNAAVGYMNMAQWDACADPTLKEEDFAGEDCVIGLDLAAKVDLAARAKLFRRDIDGVSHYFAFVHFYLPAAAIADGRNASYETWAADGWINTTPGEVLDFDIVARDIRDDATAHRIIDVAYDPWQALKLASELAAEDIPVIEYRPTTANFSPPMKEIDALVRQGRLHHNGNDVLRWNVSCVEVLEDFKGNIYPRKDRDNPQQKIDGFIALLSAMGRLMALEAEPVTDPGLSFIG